MNKCFSYITIALLATTALSIAAPDKGMIEAKETAAWKELSDMKKWEMKSFKISGFKAFSDEKDIMVTSYTVTLKGVFDGKDASGTMNAGTVWKLENGKWLAIFHTNVKQAK